MLYIGFMVNKRRSYEDACAGAHALDLIGERWAMLVVRELILGPKRFTDLKKGLPGISPNVLTQRLNELESTSIVFQRRLPAPANIMVYDLTDWGRELEDIIIALGQWGVRSPTRPQESAISIDSLMISFKAMLDPTLSKGLQALYQFEFGNDSFLVNIQNSKTAVSRGHSQNPDITIQTDHNTLASLVYGGASLEDAIHSKALAFTGDKQKLETFLMLYPFPKPAPNTYTPKE